MRHFDNSINSVQAPEGWGTQLGHVGTTWDMLRTRLDSVITSNQVGGSPFLSNLLPAFSSTPDELGNLFVGYLYTLDMTLCHTLVYTHISYMYIYIHGYTRPHPHTHIYIYTHTQPTLKTTVQRRCRWSTICHVIQMFHQWTLRTWWIFWAHFLRLMLQLNAGPTKVIRLEWHFCFVWKLGPPWTIPW